MDKLKMIELNSKIDNEQKEILKKYDNFQSVRKKGREWNRFHGDVYSRIVACYLSKHLPENYKVIRQSWIDGSPIEFDLLVVESDTKPIDFTGAYSQNEVRILIEVKGAGIFFKNVDVEKIMKEKYSKWQKGHDKPILYLSFWETKFKADETIKALSKEIAFFLRIDKIEIPHEWERFLTKIKSLL